MSSRDLFHNINPIQAIPPAAATTDNTPWVSSIIDTKGYESLTFAINLGSLADADATFVVLIEDGAQANLSDNAAVDDNFLLGLEVGAGFTFADDNKTRKIGVKSHKRYVRMTITPANNTGNAFVSALAILGHPANAPTPNTPA